MATQQLPAFALGAQAVALTGAAGTPLRTTAGPSGYFSFPIEPLPGFTGMTTSAGAYRLVEGQAVLVRRLWDNVFKPAPVGYGYFDFKDDYGYALERAGLWLEVVVSNVVIDWQGGWLNTSTALTGPTKHRPLDPFAGLCIYPWPGGGQAAAYVTGYTESETENSGFQLATPQVRESIGHPTNGNGLSCDRVKTDGTRLYYPGTDPYNATRSFIYAVDIATREKTIFSQGVVGPVGTGVNYRSVFDLTNEASYSVFTGFTVSASSPWAISCRGAFNMLTVSNRTTGQLAQRYTTFPLVAGAVLDGDFVWLGLNKTQVVKCSLDAATGVVGAAVRTLPDALDVVDMHVMGRELSVQCGGQRQTIRVYDTQTGEFLREGLRVGGNMTSPVCADLACLFMSLVNNTNRVQNGAIDRAANGDYWFTDIGNNRIVHTDSQFLFIEEVATVCRSYGAWWDPNEPSFLQVGNTEYRIDHDQPQARLGWRRQLNLLAFPTTAGTSSTQFPTTLSNGRRYGFIYDYTTDYKYHVVELAAGGLARDTGGRQPPECVLYPDGSLRQQVVTGKVVSWQQTPPPTFDAQGNPQWATFAEVERYVLQDKEVPPGSASNGLPGEITPNGTRLSYQAGLYYEEDDSYHLLGVRNGRRVFGSAKTRPLAYTGNSPLNGDFETGGWSRVIDGNGVKNIIGNSASRCIAFDNLSVEFKHGEYRNNSQQFIQNVRHENGLMVAQNATDGRDLVGIVAARNFSGNAITGQVLRLSDGRRYLVCGDEAIHGMIHRLQIQNQQSIRVLRIDLT